MYAATSNSKIYHLADQSDHRTLCGVRFMPIVMEQPRAAGLSLMKTKPNGYSLGMKRLVAVAHSAGAVAQIAGNGKLPNVPMVVPQVASGLKLRD